MYFALQLEVDHVIRHVHRPLVRVEVHANLAILEGHLSPCKLWVEHAGAIVGIIEIHSGLLLALRASHLLSYGW